MDRHHHSNTYNSIGNTNRRFKTNYHPSNYQPSTTYSINFSVPASQNVITRPYLPGEARKEQETTHKSSYNSNLNKYKLLEKELDKRKKQQQLLAAQKPHHQPKPPGHSQSYSNIFSNRSPQFANRDRDCQLAKPTPLRSNASTSTSCDTTNSLNDLYKVENLFNLDLDRKQETGQNASKSKSIEFVQTNHHNNHRNNHSPLANGQPPVERRASAQKISEKLNDKLNRRSSEKLDRSAEKLDRSVERPSRSSDRSRSASPAASGDSKPNHHHRHHHQAKTKPVDKKVDETVQNDNQSNQTKSNNQNSPNNRSNQNNSESHRRSSARGQRSADAHHPKIVLTQPSIDLDVPVEQESRLNRDRLNVYSTAKQDVDSAAKNETKSNCWFSWFKVFLSGYNDSDSAGRSRVRRCRDMTFVLLKKWYRELFLASILLICIFNAIRTSNLATRKAKLPEKFFPPNSLIHDYEFGDITELSQLAFQHEVTVVMYYSPWSSDCIAFRDEYLKISHYYKEQIFFAAVNCWWADGECSKSYRIKKYPVLISHIRNIGEVEYRGPLVTSYLIPFLDNLLNPVKPILNEGDLLDLKARHDAVVVGYFDFNENPNPNGYKHFLLASIKALYQDPFRRVQFAIVSSKKAALKLNLEQSQSVQLFGWNSTHNYRNKLRKIDNFLRWIYSTLDEIGPLVEWITPVALKSDTLSVKLLAEPTLILFTPRSLILNISPYYDILREVAMDYYNCDSNPQIKSLIHRIILRRRLKEEKLFELEEKCHEIAQSKANIKDFKKLNLPQDFVGDDRCCHSSIVNWRPIGKPFDKQCYCTACVNINKKICPSGCKKFNCLATASRYLTSFEPNIFNSTVNLCSDLKSTYYPKYTPFYDIKMSCTGLPGQSENGEECDDYKIKSESDDSSNAYKQPAKPVEYDESMERMLKNFEEQHCKRLSLGLNYNDFNFPDSMDGSNTASQKWRQNFTGLGCVTNKTLGFIAIDSLMYQSFTESLGINAFNETHATVIMIVEAQEENIYVLNHQLSKRENEMSTINKKMIYEFIKDYSESKLRRYLRSPLEKEISSSEDCVNKTDDAGRRVICVPEVTTLTFNEIVLDDSRDVLILYYTPWCVFCSAIASTFLTVAKFFTGIEGILFARLNADANNLPFEYSVDRYPTLMLFPSKRKSESVTFPANMPITTSSLLQFVLANVQEKVKYQSSFQLCNRECLKRNFLAHHVESKELNLERLRLANRMDSLKRELKSLLDNPKNKNLKGILSDYLVTYGRMLRGKENRLNLFNNLKAILSKRMLNFDDELAQDLNNQLLNDMINVLNAPTTPAQQTTSKEAKQSAAPKKVNKSKKSKASKKNDEL